MAIATKTRKKPAHIKKVSGEHHRKNKVYSKAYWPYLPMLLVVGLGIVVNSVLFHDGHVLGAQSNLSATSLLSATNTARASEDEHALTLNQALMTAAQNKASNMVSLNYWSHDTPSGQTPWSFIIAAGYNYQAAGENLAYGFNSATQTLTAWMNSPEHRANILDSNYQNVGFGIASSPDYQNQGPEVVIVAMYAEPVSSTATITAFVAQKPTDPSSSFNGGSSLVSRLQLMPDGSSQWTLLVVVFLAGAAATVFIIRHGLRLKRLVTEGEAYITHHPVFDIILVVIVTASVILTRTTGFVR